MPVPRLPPAALSPSALPFSASGKKKEMFVIDEAKLPPPRPARAAHSEQGAERGAGLRDRPGERGGGQHQQEGGDDGPVAAAEDRHGERVGDPQRRADQAGEGDEPELLVQRQAEAGCGQVWHDHAPQGPDAEAEELGEDRDRQVAPGNGPAAAAPEDRVLRVPVVDPATRPVYGEAGAGDGTLRGCLQRGEGLAGGSGHRGSFSDGPAWAGPEKRRNVVFPERGARR